MPRLSFRGRRVTGPGRAERRGTPRWWVGPAALILAAAAGCAPAPPRPASTGAGPAFRLGRDTFAFANLVRAERPGLNDGFANYCLIMSRAAAQFFRFARFDPRAPAVAEGAYARLVRAILDRSPWDPPLPPASRVVIPGFADLHAFSRVHEATLKAAFGSSLPSMMHWRTWRVSVAFSPDHQAGVAGELAAEVDAGRPAPVMITTFPAPDVLNHAVLVYARRPEGSGVEFLAYDPNDPGSPLGVHYDPAQRAFFVGPLPYSPPGRIRAFRLYTSPWF